ncbi:glycerol transporter [Paucilactobacillus hokkaidonensis JCM 18461]|uniref:Glycerol transporter n=2 Tax=Paucilactobacillus hokkaidonensis TaxID=1193095 RepID=A0A0A1GYQ8_9LACO|nr:MIP/aquaporin family protein [Paucilactobacillus hokkaidonensis]KRO08953.1 glycerol uptake facilitator related permease (major Intrinsic protein family) [Paucilactobacillus hokkaidonensis]BAP86133.1 glycerol transporter [Paucilactobacillus hokkaidonensis JCM 18461]
MHGLIGELLGTCVLIVIGTGAGAGIHLRGSYASGQAHDWFYVSFVWGIAVTMGVYVAASLGSLGHLNPAITIAYALFGLFPWNNVIPYLIGQFIGAFIGAAIVIIQFYPHFLVTKNEKNGNSVGIFATLPAIKNPLFNFFSEVIATFFFVLMLLNLGNFTQGLKPIIVGLVIFVIGAGLGTTTGFAINPARDWGPRLAYTILPVPHKGSSYWNYAWVPMVGPISGAVLATGLQVILK